MKLLIVTQSIDKNNPILGFFHRWVEEFSKHFESIVVICLEKGEYDLPSNVKVLSLGKESGVSRLKYIFNFYKYILSERKNYDAVFVHMNQEYILLGSKIWFLLGKKMYMWRNHHAGSLMTLVACYICDKIFCTSKYSYTSKFIKTILMPVGIDTEKFKINNQIPKIKNSILFLGRIAPVKKPHILIDTLKILKDKKVYFTASIYGDALPKDKDYYESLVEKVRKYDLVEYVQFHKGIPNAQTVSVYNVHEIYVNLSSSGMFDKTIGEAMACGCLVLASNDNLVGSVDMRSIISKNDPKEISEMISVLLSLSPEERQKIILKNRDFVKTQSIDRLVEMLKKEISS